MNSYKTLRTLGETNAFLQDRDISLDELEIASGFEFMALQAHAAEKILVNDADRSEYVSLANRVKDAFKALLPDPKAKEKTRRVQAVRSLAKKSVQHQILLIFPM